MPIAFDEAFFGALRDRAESPVVGVEALEDGFGDLARVVWFSSVHLRLPVRLLTGSFGVAIGLPAPELTHQRGRSCDPRKSKDAWVGMGRSLRRRKGRHRLTS